jgi:hypothetical protein
VQAAYELESNILKESLKLLANHSPAGLNVFFSADPPTLINRLQILLIDNENSILKREFVQALLAYQFDA